MTLIGRSRERGVETLSLDAPQRRNALSAALVGELADALGAAGEDTGVRAVVLTHTGTTFSAGADLRDPPAPEALVGLLRGIVELPKPVLARVTGHVRAGGLGLLAACDVAVASHTATFAFTEVRIGVAPAVISLPLLPRHRPARPGPLLPHRRTPRHGRGRPHRPAHRRRRRRGRGPRADPRRTAQIRPRSPGRDETAAHG
ncbi:hypothetical protein GCM10023238_40470 [Streptomyces heliomycini]